MTRLFTARPFIIAEVGSNWATCGDLMASISAAKAVGADAVKFQLFDEVALYGQGFAYPSYGVGAKPPFLPAQWLSHLKEKADACGIELMCTAFSPELVAAVDPFVSVHKVASSDCTWPQLIEAVAKTGKPVLLSTGASSEGDIRRAWDLLGESDAAAMYCVSAYPARTIDLGVIERLLEMFGSVGFSDHSTDIVGLPVEACRMYDLVAIEKHFTAFPDLQSPDRPHSLTADEFKLMVDHIRGERQPVIGPTFEEKAMMLRHNRRLIATRDVSVGDTLQYGVNYGAYRSLKDDTRGLSPFAWESVEGRGAITQINRGDAIGPGDFQ